MAWQCGNCKCNMFTAKRISHKLQWRNRSWKKKWARKIYAKRTEAKVKCFLALASRTMNFRSFLRSHLNGARKKKEGHETIREKTDTETKKKRKNGSWNRVSRAIYDNINLFRENNIITSALRCRNEEKLTRVSWVEREFPRKKKFHWKKNEKKASAFRPMKDFPHFFFIFSSHLRRVFFFSSFAIFLFFWRYCRSFFLVLFSHPILEFSTLSEVVKSGNLKLMTWEASCTLYTHRTAKHVTRRKLSSSAPK